MSTRAELQPHSIETVRSINALPLALSREGVNLYRMANLYSLDLGRNLTATITLCPLYAPSDNLRDSRLIDYPSGISDSRVADKWTKGVKTLVVLDRMLQELGGNLDVVFTFADLGVIQTDPEQDLSSSLAYHEELYRSAAERDLAELDIQWQLQRYSDFSPEFPLPIITSAPTYQGRVPRGRITRMIGELMEQVEFDPSVINPQTGRLNREARSFIAAMANKLGPEIAQGLIVTYATFDPQTSQQDGINLYFERSRPLLELTNLFPHKHYPRIDILC